MREYRSRMGGAMACQPIQARGVRGIAAGGHDFFQVVERETFSLFAVRAPLSLAVIALQRGVDLGKLRALLGIARRGNVHGKFEELELARDVRRQIKWFEPPRLCGELGGSGFHVLIRLRR